MLTGLGVILGGVCGLAIVVLGAVLVQVNLDLQPATGGPFDLVAASILPGLTVVFGGFGAAFGALLAYALLNQRKRRVPVALCKRRGYSLVGNVSGRCPECG